MKAEQYAQLSNTSGSSSEDEERIVSLRCVGLPQQQQQRRPQAAVAGKRGQHGTAQFAIHCTPAAWQEHPPPPQQPPLAASPGRCSPRSRCTADRRWLRGLLAAAVLAAIAWVCLSQGGGHITTAHPWRGASASAPTAAGAAGSAAHGQSAQQQQCHLQLDGSPWDAHCQRLQRVCVDQGMLILYEDRYQQMDGRRAGSLPELLVDTSKIYEYPWRKTSRKQTGAHTSQKEDEAPGAEDGVEGAEGPSDSSSRRGLLYEVQNPTRTRRIPALPMRPATSQEPAPYLQDPEFSTCTVPVLLYASWRGNFFHIFKDLSAAVYAMLRRTPWRAHAKLVSVTPEGLPLTQPEASLLPLLSPLSVQTMADFSSRLPRGYRPEMDDSQPPASYEGGARRCFQTLYFCGRNLPLSRGLPAEEEAGASEAQQAAALTQQVPIEPYSYGQAVVQYMQQPGRQQNGSLVDGIALQLAAAAAAGGPPLAAVLPSAERASTSGRLRILLMKRGSEGRQILNTAELLQRCNEWRHTPAGGGPPVTAECREVTVPDLESGVAAAREADVFIGVHGANLANGWMMRPGSSVIELIPYQFDTGRGALVFSTMNAKDATSQVLWWVGVLCDPSASTPGPEERAGAGLQDWWPRDRNTRVPWTAIEAALADVVAAGGRQQRYLQDYYAPGLHRFNFNAAGVVSRGLHCPNATAPDHMH